jgi:hypothetical protein
VPVAVHGTEAVFRRRLRRPRVRLCIGAPLVVERVRDDRPLNRRTVAATTETIRAALAQLVADSGAKVHK